jgi:hypothetical protein
VTAWPWPGDTPLDAARRIARSYRDALQAEAPAVCAYLDAEMDSYGQRWLVEIYPTGSDEGYSAKDYPVPYDLHDSLIDVGEAGRLAGVKPAVVRNWIHRGYRGRDGSWTHLASERQGRRRYVRPIDVLRAEAATRRHGRRTLQPPRNAL